MESFCNFKIAFSCCELDLTLTYDRLTSTIFIEYEYTHNYISKFEVYLAAG